jgi:hypothetical protein
MDTIHDPADNPENPQSVITPYFLRIRRELDAAARRRGLPPEPWAA